MKFLFIYFLFYFFKKCLFFNAGTEIRTGDEKKEKYLFKKLGTSNLSILKTTQYSLLKLKKCSGIMKRITVICNCNALSVTEIFCWFNKQVQKLKIAHKKIPLLCHFFTTQTPREIFSVVLWWDTHAKIYVKISLRFLMKIIKRKSKILKPLHFDFLKLLPASFKTESSNRDYLCSTNGNIKSACVSIFFPIFRVFLLFWLPYFFISYSVF